MKERKILNMSKPLRRGHELGRAWSRRSYLVRVLKIMIRQPIACPARASTCTQSKRAVHIIKEKQMLTIVGIHSYVKNSIHTLGRLVGINLPKTLLICFCEQCGYGRADHPKTAGKPWVAISRPERCKGCLSPFWDGPKRKSTSLDSRVSAERLQLRSRRQDELSPVVCELGLPVQRREEKSTARAIAPTAGLIPQRIVNAK